jgi:predicted nucleic-acid-binding Zn-ribbon protein
MGSTKAANRSYYIRNREKFLAAAKLHYKKNKKKYDEVARIRYLRIKKENPEKIKHQSRKSYFKTRDKHLEWHREHHQQMRIDLLHQLGGCVCATCGYSDWRALQIDHVNSDGAEERRKGATMRDSVGRRKEILANKDRYQILCSNCNWIKRYEKKESRKKGPIPPGLFDVKK